MSIDTKFTDLMNTEIDGVNSAQESSELQSFLARDPVARQRFDQLKRIAESLDGLEEVAPPAELSGSVMGAVRETPAHKKEQDSKRFREPRPLASVVVRYAYAMAAGVILGVLGYHWATSPPLDVSGVAGSMTGPAPVAAPIEETEFDFAGASGTARLETSASGFSLALDLSSTDTLEVELGYGAGEVAFLGFSPDLGVIDSLEVRDNGVRWLQHGHHAVVVSFENLGQSAATVELRFAVAGKPVHAVALSLPGPGEGPTR